MFCDHSIKISVIIPIYNLGKCIKRTIDNLKKQTFQGFEVILVNDGSTDSTHEICQELVLENNKIIYIKKENGGAGSARNVGINVAKGKYLYFLDGDDEIEENLLEKVYFTAEQNQADLVVFALERRIIDSNSGDVLSTKTSKRIDAKFLTKATFEQSFAELYYDGVLFGGPVNKLFRRKIVQEKGILFPDLKRGQDEIFNFLYYAYTQRVVLIPDVLYYYNAYDEIAKQRKYRLDYFEKTMITYFKTLQSFIDGFESIDSQLIKKKGYSFIYALENGFLLAWNPLEKLNSRDKKAHIENILQEIFVQQQMKEIEEAPPGYEKFWSLVQEGKVNKIYHLLAWAKCKERIKKIIKR